MEPPRRRWADNPQTPGDAARWALVCAIGLFALHAAFGDDGYLFAAAVAISTALLGFGFFCWRIRSRRRHGPPYPHLAPPPGRPD